MKGASLVHQSTTCIHTHLKDVTVMQNTFGQHNFSHLYFSKCCKNILCSALYKYVNQITMVSNVLEVVHLFLPLLSKEDEVLCQDLFQYQLHIQQFLQIKRNIKQTTHKICDASSQSTSHKSRFNFSSTLYPTMEKVHPFFEIICSSFHDFLVTTIQGKEYHHG